MSTSIQENKTNDLGNFILGFLRNINDPEPYIKKSIDNFIKNSDFEFLKDIHDKIDKLNKKFSADDTKDEFDLKKVKEVKEEKEEKDSELRNVKDSELQNIKEVNNKEDLGFKKVNKLVHTIDTRSLRKCLI